MDKPQKAIATFFIITAIIIASLTAVYFYKQKNIPIESEVCNPIAFNVVNLNSSFSLPTETIFYYGSTCPHCKIVEDFMKNNSIETKIKISQREVYGNKTAAEEMMNLQRLGNLPSSYIGAVPILYYNKTIYVGDKDIICILKEKAGVQ